MSDMPGAYAWYQLCGLMQKRRIEEGSQDEAARCAAATVRCATKCTGVPPDMNARLGL
jgi:hypothetical protein